MPSTACARRHECCAACNAVVCQNAMPVLLTLMLSLVRFLQEENVSLSFRCASYDDCSATALCFAVVFQHVLQHDDATHRRLR
jgi:hypothetical protein